MARNKLARQVIRMRAKGEHLGAVQATDEVAALEVALKAFALDKSEAEHLLIRQYK